MTTRAPARSSDGIGRRWMASGTPPGRDAAPGASNARAAILGRSGAAPANDNRAPPSGWATMENVR